MLFSVGRPMLMVFLLVVTVSVVFGACGPSDEELAALVEAEVAKQVALVPPAPQGDIGPEGAQGPQGVQGPQGLIGPQGPQGLTGPQGSQGATGPQGRVGPNGSVGVQGPSGPSGATGPAGPPGASGTTVTIPKVLEVEKLIVSTGGYADLVLTGGDEDNVPSISWVTRNGQEVAVLFGGTNNGMVLQNINDDGSWTAVCINEEAFRLC